MSELNLAPQGTRGPLACLYGVFDGHGGDGASKFVANHLHHLVGIVKPISWLFCALLTCRGTHAHDVFKREDEASCEGFETESAVYGVLILGANEADVEVRTLTAFAIYHPSPARVFKSSFNVPSTVLFPACEDRKESLLR